MSRFSFALGRARSLHGRRRVSSIGLLVLLVVGALPSMASAQRVVNRARPKPKAEKVEPKREEIKRDPSRPFTLAAIQEDLEQKVLPDGSIQGYAVEGEPGIRESIADIMRRERMTPEKHEIEIENEAAELRVDPRRRFNPQNPDSPAIAQWPPPEDGVTPAATQSVLAPQTVSTQWTAATLSGTNPVNAFPPDTMGAVGPNQFVTAVNGRIVTFNKTTGVADGALNASTDTFFNSVRNALGTSDPRVRYDRLSGRWFFVIINVNVNGSGMIVNTNRILIAVSPDNNIDNTDVFTFFQFTAVPANGQLLDYPTLGIDANALYIGGNRFNNSGLVQIDAWVVRKSTLLTGSLVFTRFGDLADTVNSIGPYTPQGVDNYAAAATFGYFIGTDVFVFGRLTMRRVTNPGSATPTLSGNITLTVPATGNPVLVPHLGNTGGANGRLDALDDRLFAAHLRNGRLWTAHNVGVDNTGVAVATPNRNGCRWYEIQNLDTTPALVQSGTVFDATAPNDTNQLNYWIPSIMVSGQGHVAMGFSRAGTNARADAYTCGRLSIDSLGTMQAVAAITTSASAYNPASDPGGTSGRRWGDYSYTSLDPLDDMTMWTTQEFCSSANQFGVRVAKLLAPPPPTPQPANDADGNPVAVYPYPSGKPSFDVTFIGTAAELAAGEGFYDPGPGFTRLAASVSGGVTVNSVTWIDRTSVTLNLSTVGAPTGLKTVTFTNPDGQQSSAAVLNILAPNAVGLESLTATQPVVGSGGGSVTVRWTTGFEVDNLGFNVYRENARGRRDLITPRLIAGSALVSTDRNQAVANREYALTDKPPGNARRVKYWLEDIDTNGRSTMHGPIRVTRAGPGNAAEGKAEAPLTLDEVGRVRHDALNSPMPFLPEPSVAELPELEAQRTAAPPPNGNSDVAAVKMTVRSEGWYAVTAADMAGLGLDLSKIDPRNLQLIAEGRQIPMLVTGEADGRFDPADRIEFYGLGLNLPSTDARVCWLISGSQPGLRIRQTPATASPVATGSFPFTVESRERLVYFPALLNGDAENFFGQVVTSEAADQQILLRNVDRNPLKRATIEVGFQGVTTGAHRVAVAMNGNSLGEVSFTGATLAKLRATIASDALVEGANTITMTAVGDGVDVSLVEAARITYFHQPLADDNLVRASIAAAGQGGAITLTGFTSPDVRVVDVTSPAQPVELVGTVVPAPSGHAVAFRSLPGARTVLAFAGSRVRRPDSIVVNQPSAWRTFNGADLLIVAPRDLIPSLAPLVAARQAEGLSVAVVDLEDAFDEFSFGIRDPRGLQTFIGNALDRWSIRPRYVLLVGDGTYDPRDYFGYGPVDRLPSRSFDSRFLETATDDWFADRTGDGVADAAIGRLPVRTPAECSTVVAKIVGYGSASVGGEAVFVSDTGDTYDFHAESARVRALVPSFIPSREIERSVLGDAGTHSAILSAFNSGPRLLTWNGHGSVGVWRGNVLTSADAGGLTNGGALPIVTTMTCLNGYFTEPSEGGLGERLLLAPGGGAVAVWSSTTLTAPEEHTPLNAELYRLFFANPGMRLGDAVRAAKGAATETDTRKSWVLIGDPSMKVRLQ